MIAFELRTYDREWRGDLLASAEDERDLASEMQRRWPHAAVAPYRSADGQRVLVIWRDAAAVAAQAAPVAVAWKQHSGLFDWTRALWAEVANAERTPS